MYKIYVCVDRERVLTFSYTKSKFRHGLFLKLFVTTTKITTSTNDKSFSQKAFSSFYISISYSFNIIIISSSHRVPIFFNIFFLIFAVIVIAFLFYYIIICPLCIVYILVSHHNFSTES